jgi:hypothetical protein
LLIQFMCSRQGSSGISGEDRAGFRLGNPSQHRLQFEIRRGTGETLAALQPILLPSDIASAEYDSLVRKFLTESIQLMESSVELVVHTLKEGIVDR